MVFRLESNGAKACKSCRSRQELSNEYLLAKIGVDTAENEPLKVHLIFKLWDLIFTEPPRPLPCSATPGARVLPQRAPTARSLNLSLAAELFLNCGATLENN